jgi:radical SAM family uncharacterized protein
LNSQYERILNRVQKPARYVGGEFGMVVKDPRQVMLRTAFCFPDTYEIGMSCLGLRVLYGALNQRDGVWCERAFTPWVDMEAEMKAAGLPLCALESGGPLHDFDVLAFTLQYELTYTNVLNMLAMGGVPLRRADRDEAHPLVIAGGPCAYNPEPMSDFIDLFVIGEGEEVIVALADLWIEAKRGGASRAEKLIAAAKLGGVYVPALYDVGYHTNGCVAEITPSAGAPATVTKRIIENLDSAYFPVNGLVPATEIIHDRVMLELFRGCIRGCRFCQAGFTNRPVRSRSPALLAKQGEASCMATGYEEIALTSLSTSDYTPLQTLCDDLLAFGEPKQIGLSLPSLRADSFSRELMERVQKVRKSGLTFAPEAGSARLRDAINKNLTEAHLLEACSAAFSGGWSGVKLYFMLGLPTETREDVQAIAELAQKVFWTWRQNTTAKDRGVRVSVSASCFVPKPHTPFQWEAQDTMARLREKQFLLKDSLKKQISYKWHDPAASCVEAILARGDRRVGAVIEEAHRRGCRLDGWSEFFSLSTWMEAFEACGIDPAFYAHRVRERDEVLPWRHISTGVAVDYLWRERERAYAGMITPDCRTACSACGIAGCRDV